MTNIFTTFWRKTPFSKGDKPLVSVLPLNGMIGASAPGSRRTLNFAKMEKAIEQAFKPDNLTAVALSINSPGGSPVQSRLIYSMIRRLAEEKEVPVFAFTEDVAASGGYMLAIAADEIYADETSIIGSIGVISGGFGFHQAMEKVGIERRVYTAGTNKSQLDPFQPEKDEDITHLKTILDSSHDVFIDMVKERRGTKLDLDHEDIFTGSFWTAPGAKQRGLIDGTAHLTTFLKERFGKDVNIRPCMPQGPSLLGRLSGASVATSSSLSDAATLFDPEALVSTIEEKAIWARYGL